MATQVSINTFTNQNSAAATWPAMPANFAVFGGVTITDTNGPVAIVMQGAPTSTGGTIQASGDFSGEVDLLVVDR